MLKEDMKNNLILGIIIWIAGSTVIGIPIVYGIVGYKGFCLGYTISSFIITLGTKDGIILSFMGLLMQNVIFIPSIILIASSGIKLYKSIIKDRKRDSIRVGIYKHSMISVLGLIGILLSSLLKVFISTNMLTFFIKYI